MGIKLTALAAVALLGSLLIGTKAVHAQDTAGNIRGIPNRLKIALGGLAVDNAETRDRTSSGWPILSISYDLLPPQATRFFDVAVYAEGGTGSGQVRTDVLTYDRFTRSVFGLGLSTQLRLTPPRRAFGLYATGGAGVYFLNARESTVYRYIGYDDNGGSSEQEISDTLSDRNGTSLGYKFGGGIRFGRGLYAEAVYYHFGQLDTAKYSGVGFNVGIRL